ncbi:winged helix-turn-helix transcriptional regulator [Novosphingobium terrae]|uniref:winged helix-turn-helix transcriptional regulator n=1 Tax=Novosphingobium terrae TaxID=2726189 RepID=UPI0019813A40|nr:helix-turn-helix domain-containing protein [Novosphingobium terrae]
MVKRTSHKESLCGVARPMDVIGDGWSLLIVRDAFNGARRFGEFQKSLGMARNILAARLRHLVDHGIMEMALPTDGGAHQDYVLTPKGRGLFPLLVALRQWGDDFFFAPGEQHAVLVDKANGLPIQRLTPQTQDGCPVLAENTVLRLPGQPAVGADRTDIQAVQTSPS